MTTLNGPRQWVLPGDFPEMPNGAGHNRQWLPVQTDAYSGWFCLPYELSAGQLAEVEKRLAVELAETDVTPKGVYQFSLIQHLLIDTRIDGLTPDMWQDPTGLKMPSVMLCRAIYLEAARLVARSREMGNLLRPFSGTSSPETASPLPTGPE